MKCTCKCSCEASLGWRKFMFSNAYSNKFWRVRIERKSYYDWIIYSNYGSIGQDGQTSIRNFDNEYDAQNYVADKVHEKKAKGYRETY